MNGEIADRNNTEDLILSIVDAARGQDASREESAVLIETGEGGMIFSCRRWPV